MDTKMLAVAVLIIVLGLGFTIVGAGVFARRKPRFGRGLHGAFFLIGVTGIAMAITMIGANLRGNLMATVLIACAVATAIGAVFAIYFARKSRMEYGRRPTAELEL